MRLQIVRKRRAEPYSRDPGFPPGIEPEDFTCEPGEHPVHAAWREFYRRHPIYSLEHAEALGRVVSMRREIASVIGPPTPVVVVEMNAPERLDEAAAWPEVHELVRALDEARTRPR